MTTSIENKHARVRCDGEGCTETVAIANDNVMRAQRVAVNFFGWRVYKEDGFWKHACPKHVDEWKAKQK